MEELIGGGLKQIREAKGVSLEEISQKTRIRLAYLRAIEADDYEALPSKIQVHGFLRLYTHELGVELDSLKVKGYHLVEEKTRQKNEIDENPPQLPEEAEPQLLSEEQFDEDQSEINLDEPEVPFIEVISQPLHKSAKPGMQSAEEIFSEIGTKLHERRVLISLSLEDINENIHVRTQYLQALEEGHFNELPSPVQAKGMLANYAEFLNLDVDSLLLSFAEGLQLQRIEKQKSVSDPKIASRELSSTRLRLKNFFSLDLLVMVGIFLGFAGFIIWGVDRILTVDTPETEVTDIPEVADVLLATSSITPEFTATEGDITDSTATTEAGEVENTPIFTPIVSDFPINILIIPNQQAWVQVWSDYSLVYEGRLLAGNAYDYSGDQIIEILTGNAGALQIYFNDEDIGSAGLIGQVETLTFTENGWLRPTPTNTPLPTQTLQATPTPTGAISVESTLTPTNDGSN